MIDRNCHSERRRGMAKLGARLGSGLEDCVIVGEIEHRRGGGREEGGEELKKRSWALSVRAWRA